MASVVTGKGFVSLLIPKLHEEWVDAVALSLCVQLRHQDCMVSGLSHCKTTYDERGSCFF